MSSYSYGSSAVIASCDSEPTIEVVFIYKFCCLFIIIYDLDFYLCETVPALLFLKNVEIGT